VYALRDAVEDDWHPVRRLMAIELKGRVSRAEVEGLASAWCVSAGDLQATMGQSSDVIE